MKTNLFTDLIRKFLHQSRIRWHIYFKTLSTLISNTSPAPCFFCVFITPPISMDWQDPVADINDGFFLLLARYGEVTAGVWVVLPAVACYSEQKWIVIVVGAPYVLRFSNCFFFFHQGYVLHFPCIPHHTHEKTMNIGCGIWPVLRIILSKYLMKRCHKSIQTGLICWQQFYKELWWWTVLKYLWMLKEFTMRYVLYSVN